MGKGVDKAVKMGITRALIEISKRGLKRDAWLDEVLAPLNQQKTWLLDHYSWKPRSSGRGCYGL
jgi:hypothetical protein